MTNFTKEDYEKNLSEQLAYSKGEEQKDNAEAALYSLIFITCLVITIGAICSIYLTIQGG